MHALYAQRKRDTKCNTKFVHIHWIDDFKTTIHSAITDNENDIWKTLAQNQFEQYNSALRCPDQCPDTYMDAFSQTQYTVSFAKSKLVEVGAWDAVVTVVQSTQRA